MKVAKFGGTSLASAEQIQKVGEIVRADPERRLVVVSAPGRRSPDDEKVTDLLIACAEAHLERGAAQEELCAVTERYRDIAEGLGLSQDITQLIATDLLGRLDRDTGNRERFIDALKAAGEDNCAKLVAEYLSSLGTEAHYIDPKEAGLLVSDEHANAQVLPESFESLRSLGDAPGVSVFPGFFGYSPEGALVTFPRGGSDITGAILAAAVGAQVYENFTDVDGVFAANPKVVANARLIPELTYREMRELSYAGFAVLHEEALAPVVEAGISVCIKNTDNPDASGTLIVPERWRATGPVVGIASDGGFCTIFVSKYLMNREIGFGRRLLQILEEEGMSYEHTPSGIDSISIIVRESQLDEALEARVAGRIKDEVGADSVDVVHGLALVMIVGEGMRHTVGVAARATGAFARAGVNIEMINQGSSEISVMFGVKDADAAQAVRSLYREFFERR